ncbi:MAG: 2Fe-2S iron-sulfur cluster binding domain-containing protein [Hyphomicrobiaceae bacterium]|nr:2Fe-2S iron-sulfur cluster binding domain-containing protein [Hyphomicrobiaceae bacterium]
MARGCRITVNGKSFLANRGEKLLDAALQNDIEIPFDCRAGHCGACCVRLVSGQVRGGKGVEPDIVHACQCRIDGDTVVESRQASRVRSVEGTISSLRSITSEVVEVGIRTNHALIHHAGQYAKVRFKGYPSRPYSITHPLPGNPATAAIWFHIRRVGNGRVTSSLGSRIGLGHHVTLTGPYGAAHFRPNQTGRLLLVATNTGFAPIWSIAVAALRENPRRPIMLIAGGRSIDSLYMAPALEQLSKFPGVCVVPVCSTPQSMFQAVQYGRPTDYLPRLLPTDVVYACGAPGMVEAVKNFAALSGTVCYADPFLPAPEDEGLLRRVRSKDLPPFPKLLRKGPRGRRRKETLRSPQPYRFAEQM